MPKDFPERDWKILSELKEVAYERFCGRVLEKTSKLISDTRLPPGERFTELQQLIKTENKELSYTFGDHRRSTAIIALAAIVHRHLLTGEEIARFSEPTRVRVYNMLDIK